jgi:hypothetical protein
LASYQEHNFTLVYLGYEYIHVTVATNH